VRPCRISLGGEGNALYPVLSTESRTRVVTRTHSTFGDRAFAAAGPGTVYRHISEMLTYRTVGSGGH